MELSQSGVGLPLAACRALHAWYGLRGACNLLACSIEQPAEYMLYAVCPMLYAVRCYRSHEFCLPRRMQNCHASTGTHPLLHRRRLLPLLQPRAEALCLPMPTASPLKAVCV